jgi:hypothetical protein
VHPYSVTWDAEAVALVPTLCVLYVLLLRVYPVARWRIVLFGLSQALILAVFISPLETIALHYLLTAHLSGRLRSSCLGCRRGSSPA